MHRGCEFGLHSRGGTPTSPATGYPLSPRVLDTQTFGICGPELAELALGFLPKVDCVLTPDPAASCFVELGSALGRPLGCSDPSTPACSFERLLSCLYCLFLLVLTCNLCSVNVLLLYYVRYFLLQLTILIVLSALLNLLYSCLHYYLPS